jgi:hypothetical protein
MHFQVNVPSVDFCQQVVLCNDPWGEKLQWDAHILVLIEWHRKVKKFDVEAHILCLLGAEHTIPMLFDVVMPTVCVDNLPG